jgi:hypothetical protein
VSIFATETRNRRTLQTKGRRNGFFDCRIGLDHKANVKLVKSQICIVT